MTPEQRIKRIERAKLWQKENRERAYQNHLKYRNKDRKKFNEISRKSREKNREERLERRRKRRLEKRQSDPIYKFTENLRSLVSMSFKNEEKSFRKRKKTEEILGCSIENFIEYILSKCPEGITLKDFGRRGYQLDHKIPISSAKTEEEIINLCHYTNFQPLLWIDNIRKSNKLI